jgi:hypothetical protein
MLSPKDKANFLPPGFDGNNGNAVESVQRLVASAVKSEKGVLRGCVSV